MKKAGLAIVLTGLLSASIAAVAQPATTSIGYSGGYTAISSKTKTLFPATDITIVNASDSVVNVSVPNTPVNDWVYVQSSPYHITNNNGAYFTPIVISDNYQFTIFNRTVCPRALITVYGSYGHFTWNVDEEYCY